MAFFKKAKQRDAAEAAKKQQELADGVEKTQKFAPRVNLKKGLNALLWLPSIDEDNGNSLRHAYLHYGPKHVCGRPDSQLDPKSQKIIDNRNFRECHRCITAWNIYDDNVTADQRANKQLRTPHKNKWSDDSGNQKTFLQVLDLNPFFSPESTGQLVKPDKKILDEWFEPFLEVLKGGEVPEGMPEDIAEAALAGPCIIDVNRKVGVLIQGLLGKTILTEEGFDPLLNPDQFVFQLDKKVDTSGTAWTQKNGQPGVTYTMVPSFSPFKRTPWISKKKVEALIEAVEPRMQNLHDPKADLTKCETEEEIVLARGRALERLNDEDMIKYLAASKHSFWPADPTQTQGNDDLEDEDDDEDKAVSVNTMSDPDAFASNTTALLDGDEQAALEALRGEIEDEDE